MKTRKKETPKLSDQNLEMLLSRLEAIPVLEKGGKGLEPTKIDLISYPRLSSSMLGEYDAATQKISYNIVYEAFAPPIKNLKSIKEPEKGQRAIGVMRADGLDLVCLNAQGVSFIDTQELNRPVFAVDMQLELKLKADLDIFLNSLENPGKTLKVYKFISNIYRLDRHTKVFNYFAATNESGSEGYLFVRREVAHSSMTSPELLSVSRDENKPAAACAANITYADKFYRISKDGNARTNIPYKSPAWEAYTPMIYVFNQSLFVKNNTFELKKLDAFLNGAQVDFNSLLKDINEGVSEVGRKYLADVKPKLINGKVEYLLPPNTTISEDLDVFLQKIKILYGNDEATARKVIAIPRKSDEEASTSSMYG